MKLCFSTLGCAEKSLEDIIVTAQRHNISNIEIRGINGVVENSQIPELSASRCETTSLLLRKKSISPIVLGTSCSFHNADKFDKAIEDGRMAMEIAESLNAPYIRVFGDRIKDDECIDRVARGISALCEYSKNVSVLLEVHGDFNTTEALRPVIDRLSNVKSFGLIWDIEHTHHVYGNEWRSFYASVRPFVKHVHIKDYSDKDTSLCLVGEGDVPIKQIVTELLGDGYDGCFSLEWEKHWHPELPDIDSALDSFVRLMNEAK